MWWIIAALILVGILLMLIELLLIPGVGAAGILSMISLVAACWYGFTFIGSAAGWITTAAVIVLLTISMTFILRAKTWKKFELSTEVSSKVNLESEKVSAGERGVTETRLAPMGTARFVSGLCEVKSHDNSMVGPGTEVEIVRIEDNKVIVKPVNN